MKYFVEIEGNSYEVEIGPGGASVDGRVVEADLKLSHGSPLWHLVLDGRSHTVRARRLNGRGEWEIEVGGRRHQVLALDERGKAIRRLTGTVGGQRGPQEVKAPMPGLVIQVEVEVGAEVEQGQGLVVIEAMKMENEIKATAAGRVTTVQVTPGQTVDKGEPLLVLDPFEPGA